MWACMLVPTGWPHTLPSINSLCQPLLGGRLQQDRAVPQDAFKDKTKPMFRPTVKTLLLLTLLYLHICKDLFLAFSLPSQSLRIFFCFTLKFSYKFPLEERSCHLLDMCSFHTGRCFMGYETLDSLLIMFKDTPFSFFLKVYLFESITVQGRKTREGSERSSHVFILFTPQIPTKPMLDHTKATSQECFPGLPCWGQKSQYVNVHPLPPRHNSRKLNHKLGGVSTQTRHSPMPVP